MAPILEKGSIFGLGNPLLDYNVEVPDNLVTGYGLALNGAVLFEDMDPKVNPNQLFPKLTEEFGPTIQHLAGGSVQNSMRGAQWMLGPSHKEVCVFMGCIGKDNDGLILAEKAHAAGVATKYMETNDEPTGVCAVLITGNGANRSLVARLGAANHFKKDHLLNNWSVVEKAKILYASGFHCTVCPEAIMTVAEHSATQRNKTFAMNISAPFIPQFYGDKFLPLLPFLDVLFGNEDEYKSLAKALKMEDTLSLTEIGKVIAARPKNPTRENNNKDTIIIITQGPKEIISVTNRNGEISVKTFANQEIPKEEVVDTNGAGDAFVGGYLSQLVQGRPLETCIAAGVYAAHEVIRLDGAQYPDHMTFTP